VASHPIGVHIGPGLSDDNELVDGGPLAEAPLDLVGRSRIVAAASPGAVARVAAALGA
jgi:hypothetical protein